MKSALLAEFETPDAIVAAARALHARGYRRLDAYTPFPMRELEDALELRRSALPWLALLMGLAGAAGAYLLQYWTNAVDYPLDVGQRPPHAALMFVPISFEMGVLGASLAGLLGLAIVTRLPALWHPVFEVPGFERATVDRFWLAIDAADPLFERGTTVRQLERLGALSVAWAGEEPA
jgi:hypothetical protein